MIKKMNPFGNTALWALSFLPFGLMLGLLLCIIIINNFILAWIVGSLIMRCLFHLAVRPVS